MVKDTAKDLIYWMEERQRIYWNRKSGAPPPWTKDPILKKYFFCNVYREQDKVTEWIRVNWREPFSEHKNLWFAMCIARQINLPSTLEVLGFPKRWDPEKAEKKLAKLKEDGKKIYSGAYMLCGHGHEEKYMTTVWKILNNIWNIAKEETPPWISEDNPTLENSWNWLNGRFGFGPFLSYEVITDLRHTRYLRNAPDIYDWANPGPGAKRGLNRMYGRETNSHLNRDQAIEEMRFVRDIVVKHRDENLLPTIELRDIEHSLCELDKYLRAKEMEEGTTKSALRKFPGGSALVYK